jgi:hypothetical protein
MSQHMTLSPNEAADRSGTHRGLCTLRRSPRCEGPDVSLYPGHPFRGVHER